MKKWTDPISGREMAQGKDWEAVSYGTVTHVGLYGTDGRTIIFVEPCSLDEFIERMGDN